MITLTLPYPISANKYWRTALVCGRAQTYVSKEAKDYIEQVGWLCRAAGLREPLKDPVHVELDLYPARPQDWRTRQRKLGLMWHRDVRCIDLKNANKVLYDALNGLAWIDDDQIWDERSRRMEPDEHGARVVLRIEQLAAPVVQGDLLGVMA